MMENTFKLCVCASGGGGNFQSLIDHQAMYGYRITLLITDRECGAIERARNAQIAFAQLDRKALGETFFETFEATIPTDTDLVVLAGFMPIVPAWVCNRWKHKMINTHPSLLPKYGGKGMYGVHVQEAVLANHEEFAGCTVHYVTEVVDGGDIILQQKIKVNPTETAWELGGRVFAEESKLLPQAVRKIIEISLRK